MRHPERYWAENPKFKANKNDIPDLIGTSSEDPYIRRMFVDAMKALGGTLIQKGKDNYNSVNQQIKKGGVTYISLGAYDYCKMSIEWRNNVNGGFVQDYFHEGKASGFGNMVRIDGYSFLIATPLAEKFIKMLKEAVTIKRRYN